MAKLENQTNNNKNVIYTNNTSFQWNTTHPSFLFVKRGAFDMHSVTFWRCIRFNFCAVFWYCTCNRGCIVFKLALDSMGIWDAFSGCLNTSYLSRVLWNNLFHFKISPLNNVPLQKFIYVLNVNWISRVY